MKKVLMAVMMVSMAAMFTGCGKVVPAGTTVVVRKSNGEEKQFTKGVYYAWGRDKAYFVDSKMKTFSKEMNILCQDDINMTVRVKWVGSFKVSDDTMKFIVEKVPVTHTKDGDADGYQLSLKQFWSTAMEDIVSSITRNTVSEYKTDDIRPNRKEIAAKLKAQVLARFKSAGYPIETSDFFITNLDYPDEVTNMRKAIKNAQLKEQENAAIAQASVAKAERDAEVALAEGKADLVRAEADAAVNRVRSESLTPQILKVKQIEAFLAAVKSQNNVILMPYEAMNNGELSNTMLIRDTIDGVKK